MTQVTVSGAVKRFGQVLALDHVDLDIASGSFFFLLGPSGCGKTTLLRAVAGLVTLDEGSVAFDGRAVDGLPAHRRDAVLVFQNYALWPHMSVLENVAFGLVERKVPRAERERRVAEALRLVRLEGLADRRPAELSGGQQQRVALARALVVRPRVVLLDEPLSNLDANLRREMRYELKRIQRESGLTMIYVTHDQAEALSMADRLALLRRGRVVQVGRPEELYLEPSSLFAATFVGRTNLLSGRISRVEGDFVEVATEAGRLWGRSPMGDWQEGDPAVCSIRPEHLHWSGEPERRSGEPPPARIPAKPAGRLFLGEVEERTYLAAGRRLVALSVAPGRLVDEDSREAELWVAPEDVVVLRPEEEGEGAA